VTRRVWRARAAASLVIGIGVVLGTVVGDDPWWPFAPMSQYAFDVDPDGEIRSTYVVGRTTAGTTERVVFGMEGIGLGRAELEGQLSRVVADPSLLQAIAVAHSRRVPDEPAFTQLRMRQRISTLADGVEASRRDVLLATWVVSDPRDPRELDR
jgi:hypothetical protein